MLKKYKILFPLALLYQLIISIRNFLFDMHIFKSKEFPTPIISVGNITVGGTGKTPHILYLINFLKEKYNIATLSRGYKRKSKGYKKAVLNSTVSEIGDEPKLIKHANSGITVSVDANRVKGVERLLSEDENLDIILLDDAFQHRWILPSLSILLIDYNRPLESDYHLPYGNLRENRKQIHRAQIVLITKTPKEIKPMEQRVISNNLNLFPYQILFFTSMDYKDLKNVFHSTKVINIKTVTEEFQLLVITGIAQTDNMIEYLNETKASITHLKYSDHHNFSNTDIFKIRESFSKLTSEKKLIITTEKDAMRLNEFNDFSEEEKEKFYYLPIEVKFLNEQENDFKELIITHLNENSKLSKKKLSNKTRNIDMMT